MTLTDDQKLQIRLNIGLQLSPQTVADAEEIFKWIVGPQSTILPVSDFKVVKQ